MIFGELLARLTTQTSAVLRKLEKLNYRSVQSSFGIKLNKTCIKEEYKYIYIFHGNPMVLFNFCKFVKILWHIGPVL